MPDHQIPMAAFAQPGAINAFGAIMFFEELAKILRRRKACSCRCESPKKAEVETSTDCGCQEPCFA